MLKSINLPSFTIPVVKGNAYGHGMQEILSCFEVPPDILAVHDLNEASQLRSLGFSRRIIVMGPSMDDDLAHAESLNIELTLTSLDNIRHWVAQGRPIPIHLKFDTGMCRQGIWPDQAKKCAEYLSHDFTNVIGIASHFANVEDVTNQEYAESQLEAFSQVNEQLKPPTSVQRHIASSASGLILPASRFDYVRCGISIYGFWPSQATRLSFFQQNKQVADLKPVLSWKSKMTQIKQVAAGQFIGYGCTFRTNHDTKVAVVPVGYYEGFPRLADKGYVLAQGKRCPILGRVCMNMMMIDVTDIEDPRPGTEVVIIGNSGDEMLRADDLADWAQTIQYEIVTRLPHHLPRKVV